MKTLLIAHSSTVFGRETFKKLKESGIDICMLDFETLKFFDGDNNIEDSYAKSFEKYLKLPKIHMIFRMYFIGKFLSCNSFKAINIHFVYVFYILIYTILAKHNLILTIYGSDFYRMNGFKRWIQKFLYKKAKTITFTNVLSQKSFIEYYGAFEEKLRVCRFGLETLDFIDSNRTKNVLEIKQILGYSQTKTIVSCGYNSTKAQQHEEIIKNILMLDPEIINKIQFIFPMTYGDKFYKESIKNILSKTNIDYLVLEDFLYEDQNAYIKLASDIMINVLKTDSFSGSMQEFLYANNIVITGSWLPYDLFDKSGIVYYKVDSINQISTKLTEVVSELNKKNTAPNIPIIYGLSSWKNNIKSWVEVYE